MKLHYIAYHRETGEAVELTVDSDSVCRIISDGKNVETIWKTRKCSAKDDVAYFMRLHHKHPTSVCIWDIRRVAKGTTPWTSDMYFEFAK